MLEARCATAAVALSGGRVFVFGGWNGKSSLVSVECCHLQTDWSRTIETARTEVFWRPLESMGTPRYFHAAVSFKRKILIAGGYRRDETNQRIVQSVVEVFSPPNAERPRGEWTRVADLLVPRQGLVLLVIKDGLYALG
ncbi:unnamed protein product [Dibothriocephalus latus]|uniref:Uncharacterized protein n=1 Tax=Dibothriocephalus latus TaxID=60516 RepID=A0A3P6PEL0_DIBLA|nr:unnamed protein product [Dibothriocephalus latus]